MILITTCGEALLYCTYHDKNVFYEIKGKNQSCGALTESYIINCYKLIVHSLNNINLIWISFYIDAARKENSIIVH